MSRVPALIVMHADLAEALIRAAAKVYGPVDEVEVLSNEGRSRADLERAIEERVARWPHGGIVLTDFWGGSCHMCSAIAARGHGEVIVLTGLNLPVLIDFLHNRDAIEAPALADRLVKKGQDSIRLQRAATS